MTNLGILMLWLTIGILNCFILSSVATRTTTCPIVMSKVKAHFGGCDPLKCETGLTQEKCPPGSVLEEGVALCGCCSGCVKYQHMYLDSCDPDDETKPLEYDPNCNDLICPILRYCPKGLQCVDNTGFGNMCDVPYPMPPACKDKCFIKKAIIEKENVDYAPRRRHLPTCTPDGFFAPKQCKGTKNDGSCFCVDECGERTFGRQLYDRAENMTCGCTTLVHKLRKQQNRIATYHCQENGDFEPLQCDTDSGLCYCVDEITGKTTGEVLPEGNFKMLPCYNASNEDFSEGGRYLRMCESEWAAGMKISQEAALHGLSYTHLPRECDYDGGFAPKFVDTNVRQDQCVHRSGAQLGYFRPYSTSGAKMDCKCARDGVYFPRHGRPLLIECRRDPSGNPGDPAPGSYEMFYNDNDNAFCFDSDGFQFGPDVPIAWMCCLNRVCADNSLCDTPGAEIRECSAFIMGRD